MQNPPRGSSPHTRGARLPSFFLLSVFEDHPRIRGEHHALNKLVSVHLGIIPAYAGSTATKLMTRMFCMGSSPHTRGAQRARSCTSTVMTDHPRIRGEHPRQPLDVRRVRGIIPAYAGSTLSALEKSATLIGSSPHTRGARLCRCTTSSWPPDHPRIRGEHATPTRTRQLTTRIIPAYAGSTSLCADICRRYGGSSPNTLGAQRKSRTSLRRAGDHPLIRGEHPHRALDRLGEVGIIPAYAGSTMAPSIHERHGSGSSPHTRGARGSRPSC